MMEGKYLGRQSYELNPFTYCRVLNDRVRAESHVITYKKFFTEASKRVNIKKEEEEVEKIPNRPCYNTFSAIRRWKYWVVEPYYYDFYKKCFPCPHYFERNSIKVVNGQYVFERIVNLFFCKNI